MLVLSRHREETITVKTPSEDSIVIAVVDIRGDKVRIGLQAPENYIIHRDEIWKKIEKETHEQSCESKEQLTLAEFMKKKVESKNAD